MTQRLLRLLGRSALPDLSNSISIAKLRYIQSIYETPECRNPDMLVGDFLSPPVRWLSMLQGRIQLSKLRLRPFYYYLIARTKYFDQKFTDAIQGDINCIINVGCGADTRAYRFAGELKKRKKMVFECDQQRSISIKRELAQKKWITDHVIYIPIDINDCSWRELELRLAEIHSPVLFVLEGVSPYVSAEAFARFLNFIAMKTPSGSRVVYDCKVQNVADSLEKLDCAKRPLQLSATKADIIAHHEALGYKVDHIELSSELSSRLLPGLILPDASLFAEDCLLELTVVQGSS